MESKNVKPNNCKRSKAHSRKNSSLGHESSNWRYNSSKIPAPIGLEKKQILNLLDSIYKNYPIGSILLWESREKLASERSIADLEIGERSGNYPVNYLLDGQQRLSTICGCLHWEPGDPNSEWNVIFDLKTQRFTHISHTNELPVFQIPMRCLAAANGSDFSSGSIEALRNVSPDILHLYAEKIKDASKLAVDFLSTELHLPCAEALPYVNQFTVLIELFRVLPIPDADQLRQIKRWFWATTLSGYFAGWDSGQMAIDVRSIREFASGKNSSIDIKTSRPMVSLWSTRPFRANSAISKMVALMFAMKGPLDLLTGQKIDIDRSLAWSNDREFHHFFPKSYLNKNGIKASKSNVPANIIFLTSRSNNTISDSAPSNYLKDIIDSDGREALIERLESNLVPESALDAALNNDYDLFVKYRASYFHSIAEELSGIF